jgi:ubiquinone/menaquinone biosynthesis C-methylase UbiE
MTTTSTTNQLGLASRLVSSILAIKPLANFAKHQARKMMIERAEALGIPWRENVRQLSQHNWNEELAQVTNPELQYPDYYLCSFHAYEQGNLSWEAAWEVESAAYAVHATIWEGVGIKGDRKLRQSYHQVIQERLSIQPQKILDIGCSVGMSTFALQEIYPQAQLTGVDLSPYFLAVAQYRGQQQQKSINWLHAAAEATGLPNASFDLISACLVFHELPQTAAQEIIAEAHRLLRPGGHLAIMDMNPQSQVYKKMPPYILTLLKSTEPYLDRYFSLDISQTLVKRGFNEPQIIPNSPRHRTILAQVAN